MICIPIISRTSQEAFRAIERSCRLADCIELRMDLISSGKVAELISAARRHSGRVKIIVTCRRQEEAAEAGQAIQNQNAVITKKEKMAILREAIASGADFVDIELAEGSRAINVLRFQCAEKGDRTKIIVSYHNLRETPALEKLKKIFQQCVKFKPEVVKIVTTAQVVEDNLVTLNLIAFARGKSQKIISLCMGEKGGMSRVMAPFLGGYLSFAALAKEEQSAPGQLTVSEMSQMKKILSGEQGLYGRPALSLTESPPQNYVLLGNPVAHSLSPLMHNAALQKMGRSENYSAICVQDLDSVMHGIRAMNIRGASVTIPLKTAVMEFMDDIHDDALSIGAVNTIVNDEGYWIGCNTDWLGILLTLRKAMTIRKKTFAIVGAGGTARAAAYGIIKEGGNPIIVNRTLERGRQLAKELDCPHYALAGIRQIKADCLMNTTPVGMFPHMNQSPVKPGVLAGFQYVMDVIYHPLKTRLLNDAEKRGCHILSGIDMFVHQGAEQLKLWTGQEPPRALMRKVIWKRLTDGK
jgi:shikimate dehydrogenase/3-dehydroquinate dehydratase type I